jgi:hypothetical protein
MAPTAIFLDHCLVRSERTRWYINRAFDFLPYGLTRSEVQANVVSKHYVSKLYALEFTTREVLQTLFQTLHKYHIASDITADVFHKLLNGPIVMNFTEAAELYLVLEDLDSLMTDDPYEIAQLTTDVFSIQDQERFKRLFPPLNYTVPSVVYYALFDLPKFGIYKPLATALQDAGVMKWHLSRETERLTVTGTGSYLEFREKFSKSWYQAKAHLDSAGASAMLECIEYTQTYTDQDVDLFGSWG